jgi:peptide-methionine (S)-S-oxide reductase
VGTQYRSAIYYESDDQRPVVDRVLAKVNEELKGRVVTEIAPLDVFYPAEDYHQDYFDAHPNAGYCRLVIAPKLQKLGIPAMPI